MTIQTPTLVPAFDVAKVREDFPILDQQVNGKPLLYLDNAASAQKPAAVIEAVSRALGQDYATVHRGVYARSAEMTLAFEAARRKVARFIGAREVRKDSDNFNALDVIGIDLPPLG